jgi:hypothetical protein
MKEVEKIIKEAGKENEDVFHISVENEPYMRLVIEGIGRSPDGRKLVSVAHYGEQNGDLMRDPDVVFLVDERLKGSPGYTDGWFPVSIRNDYLGSYREAIIWRDGQMLSNRREMRDIKSFSRSWNRNLRLQGFAKAATKKASKRELDKMEEFASEALAINA